MNDPYDTTASTSGTTWKYVYDQGGNIQSKTAYAFTTGTVGSAVKTDSFTYGDANWKDKLTAFNGQTFTYDAIGNPTNDGTWNYTWIGGRQMRAMYKGEFGEQGYDEITFEYNENGLRTKKTRMYFDDATGDIGYKATNYTLHGNNLMHLSDGSNNLHFFYDAQNKPAVVIFNGTAYAYLYNLQGDVIGLVDSNGTKMVSYSYDAWGKPISKTGTLASTLGTIQPFRYRGYVYDEETGCYYLQSRVYSPDYSRFINADGIIGSTGVLLSHNGYSYCSNNPTRRKDVGGAFFFDTIFDVVSLVVSIVDVANNPTDPMAWVGLAADVVDLIPGITGVGEAVRAVNTGKKAVNTVDNLVDGLRIADNSVGAAKGWSVGDDIATLTKAGKDPTWDTVRKRYWKNEAHFNGANYSDDNLKRMAAGKAPLVTYINGKQYPMELHHKVARRNGGPNTYDNLIAVTPWKHAEIDPYRHFNPK